MGPEKQGAREGSSWQPVKVALGNMDKNDNNPCPSEYLVPLQARLLLTTPHEMGAMSIPFHMGKLRLRGTVTC